MLSGVFHHRNYDPWKADQVLVTGEDVIRVGGDIVWRQAASFLLGIQFVDVYVLLPFIKASDQVCKQFQGFQEHGSSCTRVKNQDSVTNEPDVTPVMGQFRLIHPC